MDFDGLLSKVNAEEFSLISCMIKLDKIMDKIKFLNTVITVNNAATAEQTND